MFSRFLNCANGTKSRNASHIDVIFGAGTQLKRNKVSFKGTGQLLDLGLSESLPSGITPCYNLISVVVSALSGNN